MIVPVSYAEILDAPNWPPLRAEYAAECGEDFGEPQVQMYKELEISGRLQCFGAYLSGNLIGFVSVLIGIVPHHGNKVAAIESIFVSRANRDSGAGNELLDCAERCASDSGCMTLIYTARAGSALETILSRRSGCRRSHTMFTRAIVGGNDIVETELPPCR